jgi:hypothetical protein
LDIENQVGGPVVVKVSDVTVNGVHPIYWLDCVNVMEDDFELSLEAKDPDAADACNSAYNVHRWSVPDLGKPPS